jgi:predicted nucleic acid-binding Zn ribbon protein
MKQNFFKKHCPTCGTPISVGLFTNRDEIIRCPKCKELLIESSKRKQLGLAIILLGIVIGIGLHYWIRTNVSLFFLSFLVSLIISFAIMNFNKVKKDLVIRNKQTNAISYIDISDWNDILANSSGKENHFEIIEELN